MPAPIVRFVYAVDGGPVATVRDYLHKLLRPASYPCRLCALTFGPLGERPAWTCFRRSLHVTVEFVHRDEFRATHPRSVHALPVILLGPAEGADEVLARADEIAACATTEDLIDLVRRRLAAALARAAS